MKRLQLEDVVVLRAINVLDDGPANGRAFDDVDDTKVAEDRECRRGSILECRL